MKLHRAQKPCKLEASLSYFKNLPGLNFYLKNVPIPQWFQLKISDQKLSGISEQ